MNSNGNAVLSLPLWKKWMYALGQLGWSLTSYSVGNLLTYFYLPPESSSKSLFPPFVYQGYIFGILTIIGLVLASGRLFDAITDPLVAGLSDRNKSNFGKRRLFLAISVLPFALLSILVFIPITSYVSVINAIWLFFTVLLFYWFMTMYVTPFFALMSEIGHNPDERLNLSTYISITWAIGFAIGSQVYSISGILEKTGLSPTAAFQYTIAGFAVIGFIFMLLPIIFIDEKKYAEYHVSEEGIFKSVVTAFKNKNFLLFTLSDLGYWVALTIASTGLVYYITTLLGLDKSLVSLMQIVMFGLSFVFYVPINLIAKKIGKKRLIIIGFIIFMIVYIYAFVLGLLPFSKLAQGWLVVIMLSLPLAIFGILPNAIIADIADAHGYETGIYKAGIFFGARTFMSKLGQSLAGIIFPSVLLLGKTVSNPIGIRLTAVIAFVFAVASLILFTYYDEKKVLATLKEKGEKV
jgi:Na+/melibiose symporter-like transporter